MTVLNMNDSFQRCRMRVSSRQRCVSRVFSSGLFVFVAGGVSSG